MSRSVTSPGVSVPGSGAVATAPVLELEDVAVAFGKPGHEAEVVNAASLTVHAGETVGLVGESGSGKTVTAMAALGLVEVLGGRVTRGSIRLGGTDVTGYTQRQWREIRGTQAAMIFQQPMRSLNPAFTVGEQIAEGLREHLKMSRKDAWTRTVEMLDLVGIAEPQRRARDYPHQFSGGMAQRAMIAMALSCEPELIIADEPTTALDVTVQAKILDLLREVIRTTNVAVLYISHDLAVVSQLCSRVNVMYAGQVIESSAAGELFARPHHPYSSGLIGSLPQPGNRGRLRAIPGAVPSVRDMPSGCRFHPRCPHAVPGRCDVGAPQREAAGSDRDTRCIRWRELDLPGAFS